MKTPFGEKLDPERVLPEYPRPQMERRDWLNLNGIWRCAVTKGAEPESFPLRILVPFSPESELSGVKLSLKPGETLWYEREFTLPEGFMKDRLLLHFGAVDQEARVFVNGEEAAFHEGGYTPFSADITHLLKEGENTLRVQVRDESDTSWHSRGKQKLKRGGIWYTPQSGIWQTVWMESVPEDHIASYQVTPLFEENSIRLLVRAATPLSGTLLLEGEEYDFSPGQETVVPLKSRRPWSPEDPYLYTFELLLGDDRVKGYFGMREFAVKKDEKGVPRLFLNGAPYFHNGLLDQGYYCDGLYTAPSDEAMIFDIETAKKMGFNMLRKHIKIEPLRWYYHCDRLGMLVWQDMINGGGRYDPAVVASPLVTGVHFKDNAYRLFARSEEAGRAAYERELQEMIVHLYNCVCIAMWVPFNEGWGQFDALRITERIRSLDQSRTVDHASGWHDQGGGDVKSLHVYFKPYRFRRDRKGRAVVLSEFGGYHLRTEGHAFSEKEFGYKRFSSSTDLLEALRRLYETEIRPAKEKGLSAAVYTQLTDVEDELNGLITYDRRVVKLPCAAVARIMGK